MNKYLKPGKFAAAALVAAFSLGAGTVQAYTLTFDGNICGPGGDSACGNFSQIGSNYGDVASVVDVGYRSALTSNGATHESFLKYWDVYSNLNSIAWGGSATTGYFSEITFTANNANDTVTLQSFDFGSYQNANRGSQVSIHDLSGSLLWNGGSFNVAATALNFSPSISNVGGLLLRWGADGYDVGIDNVNYAVSSVTAVPEPETYAMMLAGLGLLGFAARRRKQKLA